MTTRDPEILDVLRDEPELLAIADAVGETQKLPRPRRWLVPGSLAAVGSAAAVVALALLLWPTGGSHSILDRARAAVGDGPVLHIVTRSPTGSVLVRLKDGRRFVETYLTESWIDRDGTHMRMLIRSRGKVVGEVVLPDDAKGGGVGSVTSGPAYDALWSGYRSALESGAAKLVGNARIYGHDVYWLRFPASPGLTESDVAIDRVSYKPVAFRLGRAPGPVVVTRVLVFETTQFRAGDFRRVGPPVGAVESSGGGSESATAPRRAWPRIVHAPWLTAGPALAGVRLTSVSPMTATFDGRTVRGIRLVYGRTSIAELARPDDPAAWRGIPAGYVRIETVGESSGKTTTASWSGMTVRRGIYVTIETNRGEREVVAVARALRPA